MTEFALTVQPILSHKHFQTAQIVAGESHLHRTFKWIHILETLAIDDLLKGQELILTTGIRLAEDEDDFISFLEKLASYNTAALCIELGEHIQQIPPRVLQVAEKLQLPVIVFPDVVPFIEITQDIHRQLINQHYEMLQQLETYAQEVHKLTLFITNYDQLLMRLQKYLQVSVVFELKGEETVFLPNIRQELFYELQEMCDAEHLLSRDIHLLKQKFGTIHIYTTERLLNEFDALILDRTIVALSNFLLRDLYIDERVENENRLFLTQWLAGELGVSDMRRFLEEFAPKTVDKPWIVMLQRVQNVSKRDNLTYHKLFVRNLLEKYGFYALTLEHEQDLVFFIADLWQSSDYKERLEKVTRQLVKSDQKTQHLLMGFGHRVCSFEQILQSYTSAKNTLHVRKHQLELSFFFEDIPLQHMLLQLQTNDILVDFAHDFLQPLFEYDKMNNGQLVNTLKTYLALNGLKKETAQALFIVRQTLYHRLEKIESLLGKDFMSGSKRLAIELMLHLVTPTQAEPKTTSI